MCHDKDKATLRSRPSQEEGVSVCVARAARGGVVTRDRQANSEDVTEKTGHYGS